MNEDRIVFVAEVIVEIFLDAYDMQNKVVVKLL